MSGFPRPLIRLWGVGTNTKHAHLDLDTCTDTISWYHTHTHSYTHSISAETQSQIWDTLCEDTPHQPSVGLFHTLAPLNCTSHQDRTERKKRGREQEKKKSEIFCSCERTERGGGGGGEGIHLWTFFHFKSICQVKAALSHIRFWQTQVAVGDRCLNFLKTSLPINFLTRFWWHVHSLNPNNVVKKKKSICSRLGPAFSYDNKMLEFHSLVSSLSLWFRQWGEVFLHKTLQPGL